MTEQSDVELIRAVTGGDRGAFNALYSRHAAGLRRYLARMLRQPEAVEEALNDVMLAIWRGAARFDASIACPTAWFLGIAHKKVLNIFAQQRVRSPVAAFDLHDVRRVVSEDGSDPAPGLCDANTPERTLLGHEVARLLEDALQLLSPEHRSVIELTFGQNRSYQEIAFITGVPVNTVKTRMFYARRHLAELLRRNGIHDSTGRATLEPP